MAPFPRFSSVSFLLAAAVLALFLSASAVAASSDKNEKQAEHVTERDVEKTITSERMLGAVEDKLIALTNEIAKEGQAPFQFCSVQNTYKQTNCPPLLPPFPNPTYNKFVTPVVLPFANPANNFQQCWPGLRKDLRQTWQCGITKNALGTPYGNYPNAYVGAYIEFATGSLPALQADAKSTAARDAIIAVMEEFVYNVVVNMLGLGTSMTARCGFPNQMVFGCPQYDFDNGKVIPIPGTQKFYNNNPQLSFGVAPDGRVRLLIIFMVDWNLINSAKGTSKKGYTFPEYVSLVQTFFNNQAKTAPLWAAAVSSVGPGKSQFLGGGARRALEEEEAGEEQEHEEEGSLRKLPAVKRPPPKVTGSKVVKVANVGGSA